MKRIALIADYDPNSETHLATEQAICHSADHLGICTKAVWIGTDEILPNVFQDFDGIWVGTGSPYRNIDNVLYAIEYARKNDFPIFATCGGFQHMILEIGRNELNFPNAAHAEYDSHSSPQFIVPLICSLRGREMHIQLAPKSIVAQLYGSTEVTEKYYCNFSVNPEYIVSAV